MQATGEFAQSYLCGTVLSLYIKTELCLTEFNFRKETHLQLICGLIVNQASKCEWMQII